MGGRDSSTAVAVSAQGGFSRGNRGGRFITQNYISMKIMRVSCHKLALCTMSEAKSEIRVCTPACQPAVLSCLGDEHDPAPHGAEGSFVLACFVFPLLFWDGVVGESGVSAFFAAKPCASPAAK